MTLYSSITDTVGHTPLVAINRLGQSLEASIFAKLEFYNPSSSVKDRIAIAIVDNAQKQGKLRPGGTIIEASSGNTGIALAMVGAARGYHVVITMPESMSVERRRLISAFGAELVLTPAKDGMQGTIDAVHRLLKERKGAVWARQFDNEANPLIHEKTTGKEIWDDTEGHVDAFVTGIGTGGTISGVGHYLKKKNPNIHIVAVEAAESPLITAGKAGPHKIQGISANFIPNNYDPQVVDEVMTITGDEAFDTARQLALQEGIFAGISSGAHMAAALSLAKRPEMAHRKIVTLLADTGERYLSTSLWKEDA